MDFGRNLYENNEPFWFLQFDSHLKSVEAVHSYSPFWSRGEYDQVRESFLSFYESVGVNGLIDNWILLDRLRQKDFTRKTTLDIWEKYHFFQDFEKSGSVGPVKLPIDLVSP